VFRVGWTVLKRIAWWFGGLVALGLLVALIAYWRSDNACSDPKRPVQGGMMKAAVYCEYGPPDVVKVDDVEKPTPGDDQVLVRVRAASVNPLDWHYMRGTPYFMRLDAGLRVPKVTRLGVDFAGTVEAVGNKVTRFKRGDEVFGGRTGAFAQYLLVREDRAISLKPPNVSFEQAATVAVAALTALQGLRDQGKIQPGQKVLINGASGGVGTFAVQIAKSFGAEVTGVCSTRNVDLVRSIGADHVIDYTKEDFTQGAQRYDLILDNVGNHSLSESKRALTPKGTYVIVGGPAGRWLDPLPRAVGAMVLSRIGSQPMRMFLANLNQQDLGVLRDLLQSGKVKPVIDRQYELSQAGEAIGYVERGHARGKVVIAVE